MVRGMGVTMDNNGFAALQEKVRGQVITSEHPLYDASRTVYNGMIDKRPAAILRVTQVADVIAGINFARDAGLDLALRGGGHSAPGFGTCDGGLVLDFADCRGVRVDPAAVTARAEAGTTWADFNHATNAFGLATTGGIIGSTGVAGLTLGGGIGYLARKYGLSCDNLKSADVVTAEGSSSQPAQPRMTTSSGRYVAERETSASSRRWNSTCIPWTWCTAA